MAPRILLTDKRLQSLKPAPAARRYVVWDSQVEHFGVRVTENGHRTFIVMKRSPAGGAPVRFKIGTYPAMSLIRARELARTAVEQISEGKDPKEQLRAAAEAQAAKERAEKAKAEGTFARVAEEFKQRHIARKKARTQAEYWRAFRRVFIPAWGQRHVSVISRRDVAKVLDKLVDAGKGVTANRFKTVLSGFFNWAIDKGYVETSPVAHMRDPFDGEIARSRVLDDGELREVWHAADAVGFPYGPLTKLLMLTGQRLGEVSGMRWDELDEERTVWTIPGTRTKNGRTHTVPISAEAKAVLNALPRFEGPFVLTTTGGERPFSGDTKAKARLDQAIAERRHKARAKGTAVADMAAWTHHDLRRSLATGLQRLGIADAVIKAVLNHSPKAELGVTAVYSRHDYRDEKRAALDLWGRHVAALVQPEASSSSVPVAATTEDAIAAE